MAHSIQARTDFFAAHIVAAGEHATIVRQPDPGQVVARWHPEIFVHGDLSVADEIVAPDFIYHAAGMPEWPIGPEGVKEIAAAYRAAFADLAVIDDEPIIQSDRACYRFTLTGVHSAELLGIPATGKPITVTGFNLFRIENGKIAELWQVWDRLGFLEQVNAVNIPV